jgi:predicted TPR repeat methyltransferase
MYARTLGRPMTPLLLLCVGLAFHRQLLARWKIGLAFLMSYVAALLPMMISAVRFPQSLTTRFDRVSVLQGNSSVNAIMSSVIPRYLDYFSPGFLVFRGDPELRHHTGLGGELFWFTIPLMIAGMYHVVRYFRTQPYYRVLALSFLVYPAIAALTNERMHSGRTVGGVISWLLVTMVGAQVLWRHRLMGRKLLVVVCMAGIVESGAYFADYFGAYQTRCQGAFQTGFGDALTYCFNRVGSNQTLYVSGSVGAPCGVFINTDFKQFVYAYLLYYGKIDPWTYQHGGFSNTIVRPYLEEIDHPGLLLRCNYTQTRTLTSEGPRISTVPNLESVPDTGKLVSTFQDNEFAYQVWDVRTASPSGLAHDNAGTGSKQAGTFRYPDYAETHYALGLVLQQAGRILEAIEQYKQALWISPDYAEAHNKLGIVLDQAGKTQEAIGHLEQVVRIKPRSAEAHYNLGVALERGGRRHDAMRHYQQALRIKPDLAEAQKALLRLQALEQAQRQG